MGSKKVGMERQLERQEQQQELWEFHDPSCYWLVNQFKPV